MDNGLIPRRYAKALYEVAVERGCDAAVYSMMESVAAAYAAEPLMQTTMANPFVGADDKKKLLTEAAGSADSAAAALYADFLSLLRHNERLELAGDIARAYVELYRQRNNIYKVTVTSAAPMAEATRARIEGIIRSQAGAGATVVCDYRVDPALIGGFTVDMGSQRLDASVRKQLSDLQMTLTGKAAARP